MLLTVATIASCKKDDGGGGGSTTFAFITTDITQITMSTAVSGGTISNYTGTTISSRGIVWSMSATPKLSNSFKTINGSGIGSFTSNLTNLSTNTTYYIRAYAINSSDTLYGNEVSFKTTTPQITSADIIKTFKANSIVTGYRLDSGRIIVPTATTNFSLNYANVIMGAAWKDTLIAATNLTSFPTATFARSLNQQALGQSISLAEHYQVSSTNFLDLGSNYATPLSITVAQGSLTIPAQAVKQNPSLILVNFPIAYNDSISQTCSSVLNATATANVFGQVISGPVTTTQTTTVTSKNIAWGSFKINGYSDSLNTVIQKYTTSIKTDITSTNALISGLIPQILNQYNVTNGQTVTLTTYRFWVAGKGLVMTLNADGTATVTTGL